MHLALSGVFPPLPTTFDSSGDVDTKAICANVDRLMTTGLAGVLALGSNGEAGLLTEAEGDMVVEAVRRSVPDHRVLLVGVGRESTRGTIDAAKRAAALGATAVLVRPPSYFKTQMTADALIAHFRAVADNSPVPVLLYNLPGPTGIVLTVPIVTALADHPNVAGMKETSPELERLSQCVTLRNGVFPVFSGWAPVVYPAVVAGAAGGILAVANVLPNECVALVEHARAGRHHEALGIQRRITHLAQLVSSVHGVPGLKHAMDLFGFKGGPVRAPLQSLTDRARDEVARALSSFGRHHAAV